MDATHIKLKKNPEKNANVFSRVFFCFINPFLWFGYRNEVNETDLHEVLPDDEVQFLTERLEKCWENEILLSKVKGTDPKLLTAVAKCFGAKFMAYGMLLLIDEGFRIIQPLFMGFLIRYFDYDTTITEDQAYFYAGAIASCSVLYAIIHHPYFYGIQKIGMRIRVACSGLVFKKSLRLSSAAMHKTGVGQIINILSNDVARFDFSVLFLHYVWVVPVTTIAFVCLLWHEIGVSCLAGFAALIVIVPIQGYCGKKMGFYRRAVAEKADKRIGIMNEILNGIRVIKMFAWENPFSHLVEVARKEEIRQLRYQAFAQAVVIGIFYATGKIVVLCAIAAYVLSGNPMNAEKIFTASAWFNFARLSITLFLPFAFQFFFESKVTLERIQKFLLLDDYESFDPEALELAQENHMESKSNGYTKQNGFVENPGVYMTNYSAKWNADSESAILDNINLKVGQGQLLAIIGPVGAGKSSILSSILGEMNCTEGSVKVEGTLAYVPQESWVFSSTLRQNITFGAEFIEENYRKAVTASALRKDIEILPNGDSTLVGDRGVALSGGQRARVNLARALYRDPDVYLFDDPLSAVDAQVGRFLFEKCIVEYLRDKVRILVTHQLQYLAKADHIIMLRDGKIIAEGTLSELQKRGEEFTKILEETEKSYRERLVSETPSSAQIPTSRRNTNSTEIYVDSPVKASTPKKLISEEEKSRLLSRGMSLESEESHDDSSKRLPSLNDSAWSLALPQKDSVVVVQAEERAAGAVSCKVYYQYLRAMANPCVLILLIGFLILVQALFNFIDWWIQVWASQAEYDRRMSMNSTANGNNTEIPDKPRIYLQDWETNDFLGVLAILVGALVILSLARTIWFRVSLTISSLKLHARMFTAVIRCPTKFFDNNNTGRILNRFSKDTGAMDEQLGFVTFDFIQVSNYTISISCYSTRHVTIHIDFDCGWSNKPESVYSHNSSGICVLVCQIYYLRTSRDIKRLEATTRSPVFSHISATLNGLTTIRAFKSEYDVLKNYYIYSNVNTSTFRLYLSTSRWFAVVIDWLCAVYIAFVAFMSVYMRDELEGGEVALMLLYSVTLTGMLAHFSQQGTTLENTMVSVERIIDYGNLPSEAPLESKAENKPPKDWPSKGEIVFDHVTLKYNDGPPVLKDLSLTIKAGEKVGIVGRTGAGKSSMLGALFRLNEIEGNIRIDAIDTKTLGLHDLRKRISIIPQDPVLFIGTLAKNLDPFDEFSSNEMWSALSDVQLKNVVQNMHDKLDTHLQEGGTNLSVGQKQLVCLARALLRRSRILVIDEATANVDPETDALIQQTIREKFIDCTVMTIAHRLNTIMDSDRVLVLDVGEVKEFDVPHLLLQNEESLFLDLVKQTGKKNSKILRKLAKDKFESIIKEN